MGGQGEGTGRGQGSLLGRTLPLCPAVDGALPQLPGTRELASAEPKAGAGTNPMPWRDLDLYLWPSPSQLGDSQPPAQE